MQTVFLVEDGGVFAGFLAVVPSHADIVVSVEHALHVGKLTVQHLLGAENSRGHEVDLVAEHLASLRPYLASQRVALVLVADIVGAHQQLLCDGRQRQ